MRDELSFVCVPVFTRGGAKHRFLDIDIDTRRVSYLPVSTLRVMIDIKEPRVVQQGEFIPPWTSAA
jgi:hypothetical protein